MSNPMDWTRLVDRLLEMSVSGDSTVVLIYVFFLFPGIGEFLSKESSGSEVSPEKSGPSVSNEHPGMSSEEQGIEQIEGD